MIPLSLGILLFGSALAEEFNASIATPRTEFSLFDTVQVTLTLTYPKDYTVDPALLKNHLLQGIDFGIAPFRLVDFYRKKKEEQGEIIDQMIFVLEPQTLGSKPLTFWKIPFSPPPGKKKVVLLSSLVEVQITEPQELPKPPLIAPLMDLTEVFPIELDADSRYFLAAMEEKEPLRNVQRIEARRFAWLGWLALALGALFLWTFKPIKKKGAEEDEKKKARAQLRKFLQELEIAGREGDLTVFYEKLLAHLRFYFEIFYQYRIDTLTTEEFLQKIAGEKKIPKHVRTALQETMIEADRVRFGHVPTDRDNVKKALKLIRKSFLSG